MKTEQRNKTTSGGGEGAVTCRQPNLERAPRFYAEETSLHEKQFFLGGHRGTPLRNYEMLRLPGCFPEVVNLVEPLITDLLFYVWGGVAQ